MNIKRPYRRYLLALMGFLVAGLGFLLVDIVRRPGPVSPPQQTTRATNPAAVDTSVEWHRANLTLYYLAADSDGSGRGVLVEENRQVPLSGRLADRARQALEELGRPSAEGNIEALPPEARPLQIFIRDDGLAVVNYNAALVEKHPGGVEGDLATVYAIVNTLVRNFPEVASVRLLVEGSERETLAGHIDLSSELKQDLSFVRGFEQTPAPIRIETLPP